MTLAGWTRDDEAEGHSVLRWEQIATGWLFHGTEVLIGRAVDGQELLSCTFRVRLDPDWRTREVAVTSISEAGERSSALEVDGAGRWRVDGADRPDLAGCIDVDIAATPITNTFPIRRLRAVVGGEPVTSPVAWVEVPSLEVHRVEQTYRRLPDRDGVEAWEYSDPAHGAFALTVDGDGIVLDYEGFARRVR